MTAVLQPLPPIGQVDVTAAAFQAVLAKVGAFFAEKGLTRRFAVQVGHSHFSVAPDEALWEELDMAVPSLTTSVVPLAQVSDDLAVAWRFAETGEAVATAWCAQASVIGLTSPGTELKGGLVAIGRFFVSEGLTRILTVRVLGVSIPVGPGEIPLETTDAARRTQEILAVPLSTVAPRQAATWGFTPAGRPVVMATCFDTDAEHNGNEAGK